MKGKTVLILGSAASGISLSKSLSGCKDVIVVDSKKEFIQNVIENKPTMIISNLLAEITKPIITNPISQRHEKPYDCKNYQQRNKRHKSKRR